MGKPISKNNLVYNYKSGKNFAFRVIADPRKLLKNVKSSKITLEDAKKAKRRFELNLKNIRRGGNKNGKGIKTLLPKQIL